MEIPKHVAFIMDGNRRWAKKHKFQTVVKGHEAGINPIESTVEHAKEKKIEVVSFWAFSTDNWQRSDEEVDGLIDIFRDVLSGPMVERLVNNGVKMNMMGEMSAFPDDVQEKAESVVARSAENEKIIVNLGLNYGGQEEIASSVDKIIDKVLQEGKRPEDTRKAISANLYTAGQPDVDLLIRTSGEQRLSGFMPWQTKNAELYFTDKNWPDFDTKEFDKALDWFSKRDRRSGK